MTSQNGSFGQNEAVMRAAAVAPGNDSAVAAALAAAREAAAAFVARQQPSQIVHGATSVAAASGTVHRDESSTRQPDVRGRRSKWDTDR